MTFQYTVWILISISCVMVFIFINQRYFILTIKCCYYILTKISLKILWTPSSQATVMFTFHSEWNVNFSLATKCEPKLHMTKCLIKFRLDWLIDIWIHLLVNGKSPKHKERVDLESMCINSTFVFKDLLMDVKTVIQK